MTRCASPTSPGCGRCNTAEAAGSWCDAPRELRLFKVCSWNLMFGPEILTYNPTWRSLRPRVCELSEGRLAGFSEPRHGSEMAGARIQPEDPASVCCADTWRFGHACWQQPVWNQVDPLADEGATARQEQLRAMRERCVCGGGGQEASGVPSPPRGFPDVTARSQTAKPVSAAPALQHRLR